MEKRMTSGEIAKKVGISQKAVRLYDEKGLLKPSDYSEGNYRLYDKEAILILEKIIALKQVGFTLEEIYENLILGKNMDITESLNQQLELMEKKKQELEKTIACIKTMLIRTNGQPNWNDVAAVARSIQKDQEADENHMNALKYTAIDRDWYDVIFESLDIKTNMEILDLGCGFGKLWRNNWEQIPENVKIDAVDLKGSWAENFEEFVTEHKKSLPENCNINLFWGDVENADVWKALPQKQYDYVIGHYLIEFLDDVDGFIGRVANVLKEGGIFSVNGPAVSKEHLVWKKIFEELNLKTNFIKDVLQAEKMQTEQFAKLMQMHYQGVTMVELDNGMRYEDSEVALERLYHRYPQNRKYIEENEHIIKSYFDKVLEEEDAIFIDNTSIFWHCIK